jgi:hypothetical protein
MKISKSITKYIILTITILLVNAQNIFPGPFPQKPQSNMEIYIPQRAFNPQINFISDILHIEPTQLENNLVNDIKKLSTYLRFMPQILAFHH